MGRDSFQLFNSLPSVSEGIARVLDVRGTGFGKFYVVSETPAEADARAIQSDWSAIMGDLRVAAGTER